MRIGLVFLLLVVAPGLAGAGPDAPSLQAEVLALLEREFPSWQKQAPDALLERALEEAERTLPDRIEVRGPSGGTVWLRARAHGQVEELALPMPNRLAQLPALLLQAQGFVLSHLPPADPELRQEAELALVRGVLTQADPHAQLLPEDLPGGARVDASERPGGIGIVLGARDGFLTVVSVLAGSPADRAGIRAGDRVLEVEQHGTLGLPVHQAARWMKGPVGSRANLTVLRGGDLTPRAFTLVRRDVATPLVRGQVLREAQGQRIGYLRIDSFLPPTAGDVRGRIVRMLPDQPDFLGLVLDLRDNGGGLLDQAVQVADLLLDNGRIVSLRGPHIGSETVEARSYRQITQAPVIVLINEHTASAAEIVAAALRINRRALIIGSPSYGKTTIQSIFPLSGGNALKLTVAQFTTGGTDSLGRVVPHILVSPVLLQPESGRVAGLASGRAGSGTARSADPADAAPLAILNPLLDGRPVPANKAAEPGRPAAKGPPANDFELDLARMILFANHRRDFRALVQTGVEVAAAEQGRQQGRLQASLKHAGIDWSGGAPPDRPAAHVEDWLVEQRQFGNMPWAGVRGPVAQGAELRITVAVRNRGSTPLHRVLAVLRTDAPGLDGLEFPVGLVLPGEARTASVVARLADVQPAGVERLEVRVMTADGQDVGARQMLLPIDAGPAPGLRVGLRMEGSVRPASQSASTGTATGLSVDIYPSGTLGEIGLAINRGRSSVLWQSRAWEVFPALAGAPTHHFVLPMRAAPSRDGGEPELWVRVLGLPDNALALSRPVPWQAIRSGEAQLLEAPTIDAVELPRLNAPSPITLTLRMRDDRGVTAWLVWLNGRKAFDRFSGAQAATPVTEVALPLKLREGRNLVTIEARDDDGFSSRRSYVFWHSREAALAGQISASAQRDPAGSWPAREETTRP